MNTVGYTLENSVGEESDGEVFRLDERNRDDAGRMMEEEACDHISSVCGVASSDNLCGGETSESFCCVGQCTFDCVKMDVLSSAIEEPSVASDLRGEECRDADREWSRCEGVYELNEELMRERCSGTSEDACARASLEEAAMEEWVFSSDDEVATDEVSGVVLEGSQIEDLSSRSVSPAGVIGGSE